jgi:hypothetical protein
MVPVKTGRKKKPLLLIALAVMVVLAILATYKYISEKSILTSAGNTPALPPTEPDSGTPSDPSPQRVIEYGQLESDDDLKNLMDARKKAYDVGKGIDIIAKSDEALQIGGIRLSMKELQEQIRLKLGEIAEETLGADGQPTPDDPETFGIHVVQPGDNIWNIHFAFLKDYFQRRGIDLTRTADEPNENGRSSGVGKLLKFSENMVYIYNVQEKDFSENLNLIEPHSKIIVYKLDRIFDLLEQLNAENIDRIQFDGDTLWVPAG